MRALVLVTWLALSTMGPSAREAPGRFAWATGRLVGVETETRVLEIRQGNRELPFTVTTGARIVRGTDDALDVEDLKAEVGQRVRLRYTATPDARMADEVEVLGNGS